jgi:hypothetical protein
MELPLSPSDLCIQHIRQADKYHTVLFAIGTIENFR